VIRSLLVSSPHLDASIFILFDHPDREWIARIKKLGLSLNASITTLHFNQLLVDDFKVFGRLSTAAYYRLFAPKILAGFSKILYLDADIVVNGDVSQLIDTDLCGYCIGARTMLMNEAVIMNKQLKRDSRIPYFNSGVLLIDTDLWNALECTEQICHIIRTESERLSYADQCALNLHFNDSYKELPLEWNLTRRFFENEQSLGSLTTSEAKLIKQALSNPQIIHYTGDFKPWHVQCRHPLRNSYWRHRSYFHWYPYGLLMRSHQLLNQSSAKLSNVTQTFKGFFRALLVKIKRRVKWEI
jgi:lipopolysaccharide biosynthesis glycosyltransferase